jgi:hypothetical protein
MTGAPVMATQHSGGGATTALPGAGGGARGARRGAAHRALGSDAGAGIIVIRCMARRRRRRCGAQRSGDRRHPTAAGPGAPGASMTTRATAGTTAAPIRRIRFSASVPAAAARYAEGIRIMLNASLAARRGAIKQEEQ